MDKAKLTFLQVKTVTHQRVWGRLAAPHTAVPCTAMPRTVVPCATVPLTSRRQHSVHSLPHKCPLDETINRHHRPHPDVYTRVQKDHTHVKDPVVYVKSSTDYLRKHEQTQRATSVG